MTEDEQRFWDAAFVAYVGGVVADPNVSEFHGAQIEDCARKADLMLEERRKRTRQVSTSA